MSKNTSKTPAVPVQNDYSVIAEAVTVAGKRYGKAINSVDGIVVREVVDTVRLAYSTGYVRSFKDLTKDEKAALVAAGHVSVDTLTKSFVSAAGNIPDARTMRRWAVIGQAKHLGADAKTLRMLTASKNSNKVVDALGELPESLEAISAALEAEPAKREPAALTASEKDSAAEDGTTLTAVQALVASATAIRWDNLTAEEWAAVVAVTDGLTAKVTEYATTEQVA